MTLADAGPDRYAAVIEVSDLVKRYRGAPGNALDGVSFLVAEGTLFCLLGTNGAGKTTTTSILTTTLAPTSGVARIAGLDVVADQGRVRREVGVAFQQPSLDVNLTAEENIRLHAVLYGCYPWRPSWRLMPAAYRRQVRAELGTTVFLTTHYLEEAEDADAICVLAGGRIIERGSPAAIKARQRGAGHGATLEDAYLALLDQA
jgi:ABC-type multidrug transport system ATPase subunit